ncbi:TonB-dependent receptor [Sphingopyxis panaciterrulae]|uniref:Outer membrane receptor protein involved in Fe transport n=1 Tax=Sphingopyxis panaciterrulae TaxID=462372 RepID=A0A7W9EPU7_9SPHN|nr:TonB-dependent receptor [Sphingopyxis panaciterrulae]MBB5705839.1 outer membrane receptor protein involved in Fe transport [Sphingopyxis panaciterrulae]
MLLLSRHARVLSFALSTASIFATATAVHAADAPAPEGPVAEGAKDIVVTARKREERLQDVPLAIQVLSAAELDRQGLADTQAILSRTPSLILDKGANPEAATISIRGLSPTRGRSNVAILVDSIDVTTEAIGSAGGGALLSMRLLDLERVEIVRGPQSVQYGRSAFAGGIQYVTRDPSMAGLEGRAAFDIGSHDRYSGRVSVSGPIVPDVLAARVVGGGWNHGGFYRDQATLGDLGGGHGYGGALSLLFTPSPNLSFKGRIEYFDDHYDPAAQYLIRSNSGLLSPANNEALAAAYAGGVISAAPFAVFTGTIPDADTLGRPLYSPDPLTGRSFPGADQNVLRLSLISSLDTGIGTLNAWTGYMDGDFKNRQDFDQDALLTGPIGHQIDTANRTLIQDSDTHTKQFSQELRFTSSFEGPLQFTVGGLYWKEDSYRNARTITVACAVTIAECADGAAGRVPFITPNDDVASRAIKHWSAYGSLEWTVADNVALSAEGRYAWEKETVIGSNCGLGTNRFGVQCGDPYATSAFTPPVFGPSTLLADGRTPASLYGVPKTIRTSNKFFTPRFTLEWRPEADMTYYASAAKGVKPGGTSTLAGGSWLDSDLDGDTDELAFDSETVWTYEVGAKINWANGAAYTNIAGFYSDYSDKQVVSTQSTPSGYPIAIIENAGAARVWGLELEGHWRVSRGLDLGFAYTFLDTRYTDFSIYTDTKSGIITAGGCTPAMLDKMVCEVDLSGKRLERAPRHSLVFSVAYSDRFGLIGNDVDWLIETDTSYQSSRFVDHDNERRLRPNSLTSLRVGLRGSNWEAIAYVDNLFDSNRVQSASIKTGDIDRIPLGLSAASSAALANLPDPRTVGLRFNFRY